MNKACCIEHCCLKHGCKYGHEDCVVERGLSKQKYPCERCHEDEEDVGAQADEILQHLYARLSSNDFGFSIPLLEAEAKRITDWMTKFHPEEA